MIPDLPKPSNNTWKIAPRRIRSSSCKLSRKSSGQFPESRSFLLNCYNNRVVGVQETSKPPSGVAVRRGKGRHPLRVRQFLLAFWTSQVLPVAVHCRPYSLATPAPSPKRRKTIGWKAKRLETTRGSEASILSDGSAAREEKGSSLDTSFRLASPPLPFPRISISFTDRGILIIKFLQNFVKHRLLAQRDSARYKDWWPSFVPQRDLVYDSTHRHKTERGDNGNRITRLFPPWNSTCSGQVVGYGFQGKWNDRFDRVGRWPAGWMFGERILFDWCLIVVRRIRIS